MSAVPDQKKTFGLASYLKSKSDPHFDKCLSILLNEKGRVKPGLIDQDIFLALIKRIVLEDDIIALAHISRLYANRHCKIVFREIKSALENIPLVGVRPQQCAEGNARNITLIAGVVDGPHIKMVLAYALALMSVNEIERVYLVITGEWAWSIWKKTSVQQVRSNIEKQIRSLAHQLSKPDYLINCIEHKFFLIISPRSEEMPQYIGDFIVRFEGPAAFKSTYIFGKSIHEVRPVVTATFSSHILEPTNSDLVLIRTAPDNDHQAKYIPPSPCGFFLPTVSRKQGLDIFVTVFSGDRIEKGLASLIDEDWKALADLLKSSTKLQWWLIGASDPTKARSRLPKQIEKDIGQKIKILPFSDLTQIYRRAIAFLSFPNAFGGGVAASMAIAHNVPVIVEQNSKSDISNFVPEPTHVKSFEDGIFRLKSWYEDSNEWKSVLSKQREYAKERMNMQTKGSELFNILLRSEHIWKNPRRF
ncbi:hypothetical protein U5801_17745 [Lamprobacter modestohalophilus]|uniref:hypothetical protein n=1 Tax=Lamprobacter modestohalophilus TaxID=1064514 RepID=UPI002ADEB50E|nr:hypothetical protein [Lamprobacter modestohalophilus]MEA1051633.1 hypothetical protein [Lamprobacter modestohalophilus]